MASYDLNRQDIDQIITNFHKKPTSDDYFTINNWYENNVGSFMDQEYIICVYLFLLGANIRQRYQPFSYEQHRSFIKEIRDNIDNASSLIKPQRKTYLDFGLKSGMS